MSFDSGMQMGLAQRQREFDNARALAADQRTQEMHAMQMAELRRRAAQQDRVDSAVQNYSNVYANGGMTLGLEGQIGARYGMTPDQIQQAGTGLQDKLSSYDQPDNLDLQNASAAGIRTQGIDTVGARQRALLDARQGINIANQDTRAMALGEAEGQGVTRQEKLRKANMMAEDPEFRDKLRQYISTQHPRLHVSKPDKPGGPINIEVTKDDGSKNTVQVSDMQWKQLAAAHILAADGDVAGAHALTASVNKEIADVIDAGNTAVEKVARTNEASRHNYATEQEMKRLHDITAAHYKATQPREVSQATRDQMQAVYEQFIKAPPEQRPALRQQYQMLQIKAAGELGKPLGLPNDRAATPVKEADIDSVITRLQGDKANKGMPYEQLRPKAISLIQGGEGGLDASVFTDPSKTKPPTTPPPPQATGVPMPRQMTRQVHPVSAQPQQSGGAIVEMSDGTRRMWNRDQLAVWQKMQSGEPTLERERMLLGQ